MLNVSFTAIYIFAIESVRKTGKTTARRWRTTAGTTLPLPCCSATSCPRPSSNPPGRQACSTRNPNCFRLILVFLTLSHPQNGEPRKHSCHRHLFFSLLLPLPLPDIPRELLEIKELRRRNSFFFCLYDTNLIQISGVRDLLKGCESDTHRNLFIRFHLKVPQSFFLIIIRTVC